MAEGHIYIYGVISAEDDAHTKKFGRVGLKEVVEQIHMNKDVDILKVHIRSEGGDVDEGFLIYDALINTGKVIETIGEGMVASIATVPYLAGSKRTMSANSNFLIHNPWSKGEGTAADFKRNAEGLEEIENILVNFYSQKTGIDKTLLKELMNKETILTAEQCKNYGFATEVATTFKAVALFTKNQIEMTKEELSQEMDTKLNGWFSKFKDLFSKVKGLIVTTGDGTMLDFGDGGQEESQITVGSVAQLEDGKGAEGEYIMPNGKTLVFVAGAVTEIKDPKAGGDELAKLKEENEALKSELEGLKAQNVTLNASISDIKKEFTTIKAQIKTDIDSFVKENKGEDQKPKNRFEKVFNTN